MVSSGVNIDCRYVKLVKHYMPVPLPRPKKRAKLKDIDGTEIPIISVTTGVFE